jgi:hypothetical protein
MGEDMMKEAESGQANILTTIMFVFLTALRPVSMNLIVASTDRFPVKAIGNIQLPTPYRTL